MRGVHVARRRGRRRPSTFHTVFGYILTALNRKHFAQIDLLCCKYRAPSQGVLREKESTTTPSSSDMVNAVVLLAALRHLASAHTCAPMQVLAREKHLSISVRAACGRAQREWATGMIRKEGEAVAQRCMEAAVFLSIVV